MARTISASDIETALKARDVAFAVRVEVLDGAGIAVGELPGVTACTVEHNIDRTIKRTLDLAYAASSTYDASSFDVSTLDPFVHRLKPYLGIQVLGQLQEYALGVFLFSVPTRKLDTAEWLEYQVSLHERGGWVLSSGHPVDGHEIPTGTSCKTALENVLDHADISLSYGTFPTSGGNLGALTYAADTSWYEICNDICATAGWYSLWFDGSGVAQVTEIPADFTAEIPLWSYVSDSTDIMGDSLEYSPNLDRMSNRVLVRASNTEVEGELYAVVTLDDVAAGHPYAYSTIGHYVDHDPVDDDGATTQAQLQTQGENIMTLAAQVYQRVEVPTRVNPLHTAFDVVEFQFTADTDFSTLTKFHERGWAIDCISGEMKHTLSRVYET